MKNLSIDDFYNPLIDSSKPQVCVISSGYPENKEEIIKGVTYTSNYNEIGYTYMLSSGVVLINFWDKKNKKNLRLLEERISCREEFEKLLKIADEKISSLDLT